MCKTATLKRTKNDFQDNNRLMQVESIVECSKESILQYFRPALHVCYHLTLRSSFCLFLSGRFKQVYCIQSELVLILGFARIHFINLLSV